MTQPTDPADPPAPMRLVRGAASPEELAAVVAVLSAAAAGGDEAAVPAVRHTEWASPARRLRMPVRPGPDGWRGAARPR